MRIIVEGTSEEILSLFIREIPFILETDEIKEKPKPKNNNVRKRKLSLEKIKQIKFLANDHPSWSNAKIGGALGLSRQKVAYWRKRTPKELIM